MKKVLILLLAMTAFTSCKDESEPMVVDDQEVVPPEEESPMEEDTLPPTPPDDGSAPNIILIIVDDLRFDALSIIQERQGDKGRFPIIHTPHLDAMAGQGVLFENAFVTTSLCSPSRASILTGLYAHQHGIKGNHKAFNAPSFASTLQENGYHTAFFGKWHMGQQSGPRPGFDYSYSFVGQGVYVDPPFEENGQPVSTKGWVDRISTDKMIEYLGDQVTSDEAPPFCAVLGFKSCHEPWSFPPEDTWSRYLEYETPWLPNMATIPPYPTYYLPYDRYVRGFNTQDRNYMRYAWVVDEQVGKIQHFLNDQDLRENTYLIFMSDNGYYMGEHQQRDKRSAYEESIRIPIIVQGPEVTAGQIVEELVLNVDIAPTILSMAGVDASWTMDGRDFTGLLRGEQPYWRPAFMYEYFREPVGPPTNIYAYRGKRFKLVKYGANSNWNEFFDLENDPYEINNLYGSEDHRVIQEAMEVDLDRWLER